ncbi:MAG: hypothetical protein R3B74_18080 [Nitrospirales bacterium]|nr:hypothetical protein [Nitrospirales bacterium]
MKKNIMKNFVSGVVFFMGVLAFMNVTSTANGNQVVKVYFSSHPITCKGFLIVKNRVEKIDTYKSASLFLAKVQILGLPLSGKETAYKAVRVKVLERLEGTIPGDQLIVQYTGDSGTEGMSESLANDTRYFIMGAVIAEGKTFIGDVWKAGDVKLLPVPLEEMEYSWWERPLWWFSECENLN